MRCSAAQIVFLCLCALAFRAGAVEIAYSGEAEKLFDRGLDAYREGRYDRAREQFQKVLEFPPNQRSSAAQLLLGKALFKLGQYEASLEASRALQRRFPDSRYLPEARLLAGDGYYLLKRYYDATTQYGHILATAAPLATQARAAERLAAIVDNGYISDQALERLHRAVGGERLREALLFGRGRWYARLGWEEPARQAMQVYLDSVRGGIFADLAERSLKVSGLVEPIAEDPAHPAESERPGRPALRPPGGQPRLGLLLPLSGPHRRVGEDLFAGVQLANEELGSPFELLVADTGFDYGELPISESPGTELLRVVHGTRHLIEEGAVALVGPIFSGSSVTAAVVAEAAGVPLIVPLAQQSGLDSVGQHIFQLSIIPEVQGRMLGEYATLVLGLENLAVIAPLSDYGWNFEREFARVARINGGQLVHSDWYVPARTKDFRLVFEELRRVGFRIGASKASADSLALVDSLALDSLAAPRPEGASFLDELLAGLEEKEKKVGKEPEKVPALTRADSAEVFIEAIDGLVIVVESFEDAKTIVPQLHFHRLNTQVLGNDIWYDPEAIRQMRQGDRRYFEGAIFVAGHLEDTPAGRSFTDAFRKRFARDTGYGGYGYDAARLVMEGWNQGHRTPAALREWLARVRAFEGASGRISFSEGRRTNSEVVLLKIDREGRVRRLGKGDLPAMAPSQEGDLPQLDLPEAELALPGGGR